jgi:ABC-type multidrug transport system fused ATPase/permease subunit
MEQTFAPRLDGRLYNMIFQEHSPSTARRFVTGSQRAVVPKLRQLYQVGMMKQSFAGIAPRTKPLLAGASGCGKSATVRLLAREPR